MRVFASQNTAGYTANEQLLRVLIQWLNTDKMVEIIEFNTDFLLVLTIIVIFTIVQSVFGVGLLVFGTPTLLLMGLSFPETLSYLLPASIIVSFLQIYKGWNQITLYRKSVIFYMLPMVCIGLLLILSFFNLNLHLIIGLMLFLTSLTRFSTTLNKSLEFYLSNNFKFGFILTGFIHGLTNLGGAPLIMITNGLYQSKKKIQPNVAYAYFFMATIQVLLLILVDEFVFSQSVFLFPACSGIIYLLLGRFIFDSTSENFYYNLMTCFILLYGLLLVSKSI